MHIYHLGYVIPSDLKSIHKQVSTYQLNVLDRYKDKYYYNLEELFLLPVFSKSQQVKKLASEIYQGNKKSITNILDQIFEQVCNTFNLNHQSGFDLKLAYNNISEAGQYHQINRTILVSTSLVDSASDYYADSFYIIYVLIHELAHALADKLFFESGHNIYFHHCLVSILSQFTGIKVDKFYKLVDTSKFGKLLRSEYKKGNSFDIHCQYDGFFYRGSRKRHFTSRFHDSYMSAINFIRVNYGIDTEPRLIDNAPMLTTNTRSLTEIHNSKKKGVIAFISREKEGFRTIIFNIKRYKEDHLNFYIKTLVNKSSST